MDIAGENHAWDFVGKQIGIAPGAFLGREGAQEAGLGVADDLQAFVGKSA